MNSAHVLIRGNRVIDAMAADHDDWRMARRTVCIVTFDGVQPLDAIGPFEVFSGATKVLAAQRRPAAGYELSLVSEHGTPVTTESGLQIVTARLPAGRIKLDTLLIPGGDGTQGVRRGQPLVEWIRRAAAGSRRVATVCSGTFIAAEAGLLDGRTVTTHWARARQLADEYPRLTVDADPIYSRDGNVWTSAGVTAGIDLALAMVEADYGTDVAQTVARWLVMFLHRPGGQTQFATPVWVPRADRSTVRATQDHIDSHPADDHRLDFLAARAAMSSRHFSRLFTEQVGETPARYVERVRVEAARNELETTAASLDVIADHCGFGTAESLRRAFQRRVGVAPDAYRRRFRSRPNQLRAS
jgi:transcriptional regulator GlxA family with amidase domain